MRLLVQRFRRHMETALVKPVQFLGSAPEPGTHFRDVFVAFALGEGGLIDKPYILNGLGNQCFNPVYAPAHFTGQPGLRF